MIELDNKLNPVNSPISSSGAIDPYRWGYINEDGVVTSRKIVNFSFSQGSGGTLTLGGTTNGNGQMVLKDSSGGTIFVGNYLGHHYYGTSGTEQVRVDSSGLHNYNASGVEQIKVDFVGFHAYGTSGTANELIKIDQTGLHNYDYSGVERSRLTSDGLITYSDNGLNCRRTSSDTVSYGVIGVGTSNEFVIAANNNNNMQIATTGSGKKMDLVSINGTINLTAAAVQIGGVTKTAIVPTTSGYRSLYTNESPEVWFMDFYRDIPDPLFMEVTEPPYREIECKDGYVQIWGKRKGAGQKRFEEKTEEEFRKNNEFWSTPQR